MEILPKNKSRKAFEFLCWANFCLFLQVDSERTEISALKRENQSLVESCDAVEKARQKAVHDLGVKEQQVRF